VAQATGVESDVPRQAWRSRRLGLVPLFTVAFAYVSRFPLFARRMLWKRSSGTSADQRRRGPALPHRIRRQIGELGCQHNLCRRHRGIAAWQVDREINTIWGTREQCSFARRVFIYALGSPPVLLIGAASTSSIG
jgi:hypothetical protein